MPKHGSFVVCRIQTSGKFASLRLVVSSLMFAILFAGCGGGEDFSKPPAQIQNQLAKNSANPDASTNEAPPAADAATPATDPANANADHSDQAGTVAPVTEGDGSVANESASPTNAGAGNDAAAGEKPPADTSTPAAAASTPDQEMTNAGAPGSAITTAPTTPETAPVASGDGSEVITASGKSAEAIEAKKEANSKKSVMGNAGGLLGSLKSGAKKTDATAAANPAADPDAAQAATRFGRMALSRVQWLQLVSQLTRQFFVAATPDGEGLAGSTGERSLEVLDTQLDLRSQTLHVPGKRPGNVPLDPIRVAVTGLPGTINSVELTSDQQQVIIGTTDGRLLVRSTASTADWDLFARDLFLFQDEHRRTARISDAAVVAMRSLPDDRLLAIDANGICSFWRLSDIVIPVTAIPEMTVEQAKAADAETVAVTPIASFPVTGFEVLSITVSEEFHLGAIVTSSEEVYIFRTDTCELIETLKADLFADTQPVCVAFVNEGNEIFAGLADGRILRRARTGSPEVTGLNDLGETVDYESVFVPDVQDQVSSVTCIRATSGSRTIHFGTIDGTVVRYDAALRRVEQLKKRHASAVIDFCHTPHGIISIGTDRLAQLFDMPVTSQTQDPNAELLFQLQPDATLEDAETPPEENSVALPSKSTRPAKARVAEAPVAADLSLKGIRPADPALALYGHQLRVADSSEKRQEIRKLILKHRGENSHADSLGNEPAEIQSGPPIRVGDTTTQLQFGDGEWSRVLLAVSDDGTMVAALHRGSTNTREPHSVAGALSLFDLTTATALRHWTQPIISNKLSLNLLHPVLSPTPATTHFWHNTGYAATDPMRPVAASVFSPDSNTLILGRAGSVGLAEPALTKMNLENKTESNGLELFETMVTAAGFSTAGDRLIVGTRERDQVRLLELNPVTMAIQQEISREQLGGRISEENAARIPATLPGTTFIQPSPSDKMMLTWGNYDGGAQLRLWRRGSSGWQPEDATVIMASEANPDFSTIDHPVVFVNRQDSRLAIINKTGLLMLTTKKGEVERMIPIPNVNGHRPPCVFTPDGNWLLTGDGDGNVWAASMMSLDRKPIRFEAHIGPIAGLAMSPNGRYLATIGEDNHLRSWRVDGFLKR